MSTNAIARARGTGIIAISYAAANRNPGNAFFRYVNNATSYYSLLLLTKIVVATFATLAQCTNFGFQSG